jgi:hypothetical protein
MFKLSRKMMLLFATSLAVAGLAATSAQAAVLHVNGERTAITPNAASVGFFTAFGITATPTGPASTGSDGSVLLPITHGFVSTEGPGNAKIFHSGGVTFSTAHRALKFRDFVLVNKNDRVWLKAKLNDRGWVIFAWVNSAKVSITGHEATVTGELKLSEQAAKAFNWLVGENVSVPGTEIAKMKSTVKFVSG